ncbi:MAG: hypothetical protein M5R36_29020 [Deltaproteobacteria bacterium]|nr:hypothetical protein [Deltaproteobacteria bacterium]
MKITTSMLFGNATRNINASREKYLQLQEMLITNKRVNRPSDDPVRATRAAKVRNILGGFDQHQRNIGTARSFVNTMEIALTHIADDLSRARELAVDINSADADPAAFQAAAQEVQRLFEDVLRTRTSRTTAASSSPASEPTRRPSTPRAIISAASTRTSTSKCPREIF